MRPEATDHDQTVEIALGPKGAFENGHSGTLTRRVPADWVVSAVPQRRTTPTPPKGPKTPRIVELLRKAIEWQALLESGEATSRAEVARREGLTRARMTQVMGSAAPRTRDPAAHSGHARHGPQALDYRARPTACDPAGTTGSTASGLPTTGRPALSLACKPTSTKSQRSRRRGERDALVLVTRCSRVSWFSRSGVYGQPVTFRHTVLTVMRRAKAVKSAGFRVYSGSACARAVAPMSRSAKRRRLGRPLPFSVA